MGKLSDVFSLLSHGMRKPSLFHLDIASPVVGWSESMVPRSIESFISSLRNGLFFSSLSLCVTIYVAKVANRLIARFLIRIYTRENIN